MRSADGMIASLCLLVIRRARLLRSAIVLKPSTLLHFHKALIERNYRLLFSPKAGRRPAPKGPNQDLIEAMLS